MRVLRMHCGKKLTIHLVGANDQVRDGDTVLEDENGTATLASVAGNTAVELGVAKVPVGGDDRLSGALDTANPGRDVQSLACGHGRGRGSNGQGGELHCGRRVELRLESRK